MGTTGTLKVWVKVVRTFRKPCIPPGLPEKYFTEADKYFCCRNILSLRRLQKVQIVFKTDSPPLFFFFFPVEFQISADTLRQKGKFSSSLKRACLLLSVKKESHPK